MCDGKRSCLLRKSQRQFPDTNNQRINENRENAVLKFAGEISTDPGVGTEERKFAMIPCPCHVGEGRQNGDFVVVVPKNARVLREQQGAKPDDNETSNPPADYFRTRGSRPGHSAISTPYAKGRKQTPNAQRPTLNAQ